MRIPSPIRLDALTSESITSAPPQKAIVENFLDVPGSPAFRPESPVITSSGDSGHRHPACREKFGCEGFSFIRLHRGLDVIPGAMPSQIILQDLTRRAILLVGCPSVSVGLPLQV